MTAQFANRIAFKSRLLLDPANQRRWKARYLFPIRNILSFNRTISVCAGGLSGLLNPWGQLAADIWSNPAAFQPELELLLKILEPSMTFFDVGADAGVFSIFAARKLAQGRVFSVEHASPAYEQLCDNLRLNDLQNVFPYRLQLVDSMSKHCSNRTTIDNFLAAERISKIDVLRLDAHGAELFALRGSRDILSRSDAPLLFYSNFAAETKSFAYHPVEVFWCLESLGFALFTFNGGTGAVTAPAASRAYDAKIIAVKPQHPSYARIKGIAR